MKKIFYILASAIVALGAVACQNEVDENINPNDTKEITFNVSFDESTRIAGDITNGTATFEFEGDEELYVGGAKLTQESAGVFTADAENSAILNDLVGETVTATVSDEGNGLKFASEAITLIAGENNITLSLACPALHFIVPANANVILTIGEQTIEFDKTPENKAYLWGLEGTEVYIKYAVGGIVVKETTLRNLTNKVYNLGTLDTDMTIANVAALIAKAEAGSTITLPAGATITGSEILTIDKNITIDGNGATLSSTAGRAINVSGEGVDVAISNLNIECTGERGVNVIQNAKSVTLNEVNITAANYAVNVAGSAGDVTVTISNSTITGLNAVNVAGAGATVTVDNCIINCEDNNADEGYSPISLNKDGVNGTITVTNSTINITGEYAEDTTEGSNAAKGGTVTINGSTENVSIDVCCIEYGNYYYGFTSVADAIEYANEKDNSATIVLLRDTEIAQVGTFKIDLNGCTLTAAEGYEIESIDEEKDTVTVVTWIPVATVGGVEYKDLASAVAAAADGGTVTLVSDVAIENLVQVNGDVTIEGNATISNDEGDVFKVLNGGSLTIGAGVTIESTTDCGIFTSAGANNVNVVINGTVRSSASNYAAVQFNGGTTGVTLTVNGTIESENEAALYLPANGEYTIANGAKITGKSAIVHKGGKLTIEEGATLIATGDKVDFDADKVSGANCTGDALVVIAAEGYSTAEATINGGSFTSTNGAAVGLYAQEGVTPATVSIKGGTFNTDPSAFVAENFLALKNYKTENMYDVVAVEKTDWQVVGNHITENEWTPTKGTTMYTIKGTNIVVAKEVEIAANKEFKFVSAKNTSDWSTAYGSNNGTTTNTLNQWNYCGGDNIKVGTAGTYNIFFETSKKHYAVVNTDKMLPTIEYVKYYLNAGGSTYWDQGNAWFVAYFWSGNENSSPIRMTSNNDGTYYVEILKGINKNCLFRRMSSSATNTNNWGTKVDGNKDGYWNTTNNLTINGTNNCYTITGWGGADGKWSTK